MSMTIPSGLADVQGRIASIQARLGMGGYGSSVSGTTVSGYLPSVSDGTSVSASDALSGTGSTSSFADALASVQNSGRATSSALQGSVTGDDIVAKAKEYIGVPYVRGGDDPKTGLDCSGLTELVYSKFGIDLPSVSWEQAKVGTAVDGLSDAKPGDLLTFGNPVHHVAIYAGDNQMIEAPRPGKDVRLTSVYETPTHIRRILPSEGASPLASSAGVGQIASAGSADLVPELAQYAGDVGDVPYASLFQAAERKYGVPARVLSAVAKAESNYNPQAGSSAGAQGLMQFMPSTARGMGVDPYDPESAINGAARLIKGHVKTFGSLDLALAAYNAGSGNVRKYGGIPPFNETRNYVSKIESYLARSA